MRARTRNNQMPADAQREAAPPAPALSTPIASLPGIGPKRAAALSDRGISTLEDAIFHLPSVDQCWCIPLQLEELAAGMTATGEGFLADIRERPMRGAPWRRLARG